MIADTGGKHESNGHETEQLNRPIELELAEKRRQWQDAAARRQKVRMASYFFLFLLILVTSFAFAVLFSRVKEQRAIPRQAPPPPSFRP
jgi:hypothetical protein